MSKTKTLILIFFIISFFVFPLVSFGASSNFDYKVMEGIPGFLQPGKTVDFNTYISYVYKFGIWTVGIAALLMLSVGAFMYLTSAGNNAAMSSAKGVITDALIGFVLAMVAWLLLYIINPDLANPKGITGGTGTGTGTGTGNVGTGGGTGGGAGGGIITSPGLSTQVPNQAKDTSPDLTNLINCIGKNIPAGKGMQISSISDGNGGVNCYKDHPAWPKCSPIQKTYCCFHAKTSCHYGGINCQDGSHAVDFSYKGSSTSPGEMEDIAKKCGAQFALKEGDHLHASVGGNCGCN